MAKSYGRAFDIMNSRWYCCDNSLEGQLENTDDWEKYRKPILKKSSVLFTVLVWWHAISTRLRYLTGSLNPPTPSYSKWISLNLCYILQTTTELFFLQTLLKLQKYAAGGEVPDFFKRTGWMWLKQPLFCFCLFSPTLNVQYKNKDKRQ